MGRQGCEAEAGLPLCDGIFERDLGFVRELNDAAPDCNDLMCRGRDSLDAVAEAAFGPEAESAFGLAGAPTTKPNSVNVVLLAAPRAFSPRMLIISLLPLDVADPSNDTATVYVTCSKECMWNGVDSVRLAWRIWNPDHDLRQLLADLEDLLHLP